MPGVTARVKSEDGAGREGTGTGELLMWTPFQTRGYLSRTERREVCVGPDDGGAPSTGPATSSAATTTAPSRLEGRADFYVKVRGVRVSTQVVEQAIQEHPEVIEVAVVAVTDELVATRPYESASIN